MAGHVRSTRIAKVLQYATANIRILSAHNAASHPLRTTSYMFKDMQPVKYIFEPQLGRSRSPQMHCIHLLV